MTPDSVLELARSTFLTAATILAPLLLTGVIVGLVISILQTVTSVHEQTLTVVPKMAAVGGVLILLMPWIIRVLLDFTSGLLGNLIRFRG